MVIIIIKYLENMYLFIDRLFLLVPSESDIGMRQKDEKTLRNIEYNLGEKRNKVREKWI